MSALLPPSPPNGTKTHLYLYGTFDLSLSSAVRGLPRSKPYSSPLTLSLAWPRSSLTLDFGGLSLLGEAPGSSRCKRGGTSSPGCRADSGPGGWTSSGPSPGAWACSSSGSPTTWSFVRSAFSGRPAKARSRASSSSSMCAWCWKCSISDWKYQLGISGVDGGEVPSGWVYASSVCVSGVE